MKPLISVIIPTKNEAKNIETCLKSIADQTYKNYEIIVVDNNSDDDTKILAKRYTKKVFNYGPERSSQRNYGAKKAKGEYLLFIDADMILTRSVLFECIQSVNDKNFQALIIPEKSFGTSFWAKCKALEKSYYEGVDWIEASRFFEKKRFVDLGGYNTSLVSGEDWDLHSRFVDDSKSGRIKSYIYHNESDLSLVETIKKKYYYAKNIKFYKNVSNSTKYSAQSNVLKRYALFFSSPKKLFANPLVGFGMLFMKFCEYGAGAFAYIFDKDA